MLALAISIAAQAFQDKKDKGGNPYILHCIRVMNNVSQHGEDVMAIAILHDIVEDTSWTLAQLYDLGFSDRVMKALITLTHDKNVSYEDYIKAIAVNPDARLVKLADLRDNSDITRLKGISKKDLDRVEKYHKSYLYLIKI